MAYVIGTALALVISAWAALVGFDRDRAFYPTVLVVIASYYVLFASIGGAGHTVVVECTFMLGFVTLAVAGFRSSLWIVAAAFAAHGLFDSVHHLLVSNPGVPSWWPAFCLAYDVSAAAAIAWLLRRRPEQIRQPWPARP